jgi:membrane-bound acyltransferase YfiQ involved in biofilm formation
MACFARPVPIWFYYTLLALCCVFAFLKGGAPERIGTAILAIGSLLTFAALSGRTNQYRSVATGVILIDVVCLLAFLVLALRADRYWPLWITALQFIGAAAHAVRLVDPAIIGRAYAFALGFWSYPMLLLIALGTWRHQRRLALHGVDPSWSTFSARSGRGPPGGPIA